MQNPHAITTYYYSNAAVIHDELLRETLKNLGRNISVLRSLLPVVIAPEYMIAAAYFYIHIRKRELAAARSLGIPATAVMMTIAIEMLIVSAVSFAASIIAASVTPLCSQYKNVAVGGRYKNDSFSIASIEHRFPFPNNKSPSTLSI